MNFSLHFYIKTDQILFKNRLCHFARICDHLFTNRALFKPFHRRTLSQILLMYIINNEMCSVWWCTTLKVWFTNTRNFLIYFFPFHPFEGFFRLFFSLSSKGRNCLRERVKIKRRFERSFKSVFNCFCHFHSLMAASWDGEALRDVFHLFQIHPLV